MLVSGQNTPDLDKLAREELETMLQLKVGSYRFPSGRVVPYNRFPADPLTPFADPYSYHALAVHGSKFPVNIELDYIRPGAQPREQGGLTAPVLAEVRIAGVGRARADARGQRAGGRDMAGRATDPLSRHGECTWP
ncbi:hypothetical protein, partial [Cupriavidus basilensis]|uniref:hypothetical protein n=1 Tax=Cupriavidus basilensis TaxID=68895 RepID=UPI003D32DCBA|nr:hypothetical protein [Cupriavidus basilensis]